MDDDNDDDNTGLVFSSGLDLLKNCVYLVLILLNIKSIYDGIVYYLNYQEMRFIYFLDAGLEKIAIKTCSAVQITNTNKMLE